MYRTFSDALLFAVLPAAFAYGTRSGHAFLGLREDQWMWTIFQPAAVFLSTNDSVLTNSTGFVADLPMSRDSLATHARSPTVSPLCRSSVYVTELMNFRSDFR